MNQQKPISHFIAGLIIAAIIIVYSIAINFMGITSPGAGWVNYIIIVIGAIIFVPLYGKAMNNQVTFGALFSYGFKATAIITLISILFLLIFNFAFPEFKEKILEAARNQMIEDGKSNSEIEEGINMFRKLFWVGVIGATLLFSLVSGAIGSLIGAAIAKKDKINPVDQLSI